jgi:hypothetical protein
METIVCKVDSRWWCPSKYSAHPQQVSATRGEAEGHILRGSASFWVDFAAFLSVSGQGSYMNGLGRLDEYAKLGVCDFSTLTGYLEFVRVTFGDERLAG